MGKGLLILILLVIIEVPLFNFGIKQLSAGWAWGIMLGSVAVGLWMVFQGITFQSARSKTHVGAKELVIEPVGCMLTGVLLIVPGFLTDSIGLLFLIFPPLRDFMAKLFLRFLGRKAQSQAQSQSSQQWEVKFKFKDEPKRKSRDDQTSRVEKKTGGSRGTGKVETPERPKSREEFWEKNGLSDPGSIRDVDFEVVEKPEEKDDKNTG